MRRRDDEGIRLPNEVVERLHGSGIPKNLVAIRKAEGVEMPLTTRGLRALNERVEEEIRALNNAKKLDAAHGEAVEIDELRAAKASLEEQVRTLRHENEQQARQIERFTATSAMAISSGGSQR